MEQENKSISVVVATFNSSRTLELLLQSLRDQTYSQEKLEIIIADGGSKDTTLAIAEKFGAKIISVPPERQGAEYNKGYGLQFATGEYVLFVDHDNILPHAHWLQRMVTPLMEHTSVVAVEPLRYRYQRSLSLMDRYFALFGVNDPLPYYLGKADRMDYIHSGYTLLGSATDKGAYYLVQFDSHVPECIPTLGANGFLIRRALLVKAQSAPDKYFHIDVNVDLVRQGHTLYAFIKDDIIHLSHSSFLPFLRRRKHFMSQYYFQQSADRRYSVFDARYDTGRLIFFIFISLTIVWPLVDSLRGWRRIHDFAWFMHPIMSIAMVYIYGTTFLRNRLTVLFFRKG